MTGTTTQSTAAIAVTLLIGALLTGAAAHPSPRADGDTAPAAPGTLHGTVEPVQSGNGTSGPVDVVFRSCSTVWFVLQNTTPSPDTVTVNGQHTIPLDALDRISGQFGDRPVHAFDAHDHFGPAASIHSVTVDGTVHTNDHSCTGTEPSADRETADDNAPEAADVNAEHQATLPCTEYCNMTLDDLVTGIMNVKEYVDVRISAHEEQYNHAQLHTHENDTRNHDHDAYITRDEATDSFAAAGHDHVTGKHAHDQYAEQDHTHKTSGSTKTGGHDHSDLKDWVIQRDEALMDQVEQYVAGKTSTGVRKALRSDLHDLANEMEHWATNTFATKDRVRQLERQNRQLRRELMYLKEATGHTEADIDTVGRVMARNNLSTFSYEDSDCEVHYSEIRGERRVRCVK